jgi:hemerythrin-like domain-containing protein
MRRVANALNSRSFSGAQNGGRTAKNSESDKSTTSTGISLLEKDHNELRTVFDAFTTLKDKNGNEEKKKDLVNQMVDLLKVHTYIEEKVFYPEIRKVLPELDFTVLESYEEHHVADTLCKELSRMSPSDENFVAKTSVLIDSVTRHMSDEEQNLFPTVRNGFTNDQLQDLGKRMASLKLNKEKDSWRVL